MEKTGDELLNEALEGEAIAARKLTFTEQCGAFAALYGGMRNMVVARAFGITPTSVSHLSGCLENDPDPYRYRVDRDLDGVTTVSDVKILMDHNRRRNRERRLHYPEVAAEFEALGREEFTQRYYTARVHDRIVRAKAEIRAERSAKQGRRK